MCEVLYSWRLIMNKQFLSVLLLTCFVTSGSASFSPQVVHAIFEGMRTTAGSVAKKYWNPTVVTQYWKQAVVGAGLTATGGAAAHNMLVTRPAEEAAKATAKIAAEAAESLLTGKSKFSAAWDGMVAGAKAAYNGTGSAANVTAQWVRNHPGYATAAVAGIAAAGYLIYWSKSVALPPQGQVFIKAALQMNMAKLMNECPGKGFYNDGDFDKLVHREFFNKTPAILIFSDDVIWYLNDQVTCAQALNYIKVNNIKVEGSVIKKIQARFKEAQSKTATVFVVAPAA